jgi:acyl-CoA reductase-like NAD-dependent aldehyde dehydrogenase
VIEERIVTYQSVNPFSEKLLKTFDQHSDLQMESALATADTTFQKVWSTATCRRRATIVGPGRVSDVRTEGELGSSCNY